MDSLGAKWKACSKVGTIVHVAIDGAYAGHIVISDCIKSDTKEALEQFKQAGVKHLVMLTGDRREVAEKIADELGITDYQAELLPTDKVDELEKYLAKKSPRTTVGFVGDGINDAPVLARADVGIAMGGLGSDVAIEAADVVVMNDQLSKIAKAIKIARKTIRIAHENIIFSIGIKVLVFITSEPWNGEYVASNFCRCGSNDSRNLECHAYHDVDIKNNLIYNSINHIESYHFPRKWGMAITSFRRDILLDKEMVLLPFFYFIKKRRAK